LRKGTIFLSLEGDPFTEFNSELDLKKEMILQTQLTKTVENTENIYLKQKKLSKG